MGVGGGEGGVGQESGEGRDGERLLGELCLW